MLSLEESKKKRVQVVEVAKGGNCQNSYLKAILIDEKYLGKSAGFVTHVLNANTGKPRDMACGRLVECLRAFFSSLSRQQRNRSNV